ncbi:MAG: hypothetical protein H6631_08105 [Anaerolineaceae bacterium]|nr:hypothetical protein [Anaerolineaceae bacterium]MCB9099044.1 hypothetical protein [Anaerolineales bacterium]
MKSLLTKNQKQQPRRGNEVADPYSSLTEDGTPRKIKVADQLSNGEGGYFTSDLAEYQANLEALGPAIDDEESALHMTSLVETNDESMSIRAGSRKKITQLFLSGDATTPRHDAESYESIFASTGPAIDEGATAQYASDFFA